MRKGIKRDRTVRKGIDYEKLIKIWRVIEAYGIVYIAQIARETNIPEPTVRYYLNNYLDKAIESKIPVPKSVRLRMIGLKPNMRIEDYLKALELIQSRKNSIRQSQ